MAHNPSIVFIWWSVLPAAPPSPPPLPPPRRRTSCFSGAVSSCRGPFFVCARPFSEPSLGPLLLPPAGFVSRSWRRRGGWRVVFSAGGGGDVDNPAHTRMAPRPSGEAQTHLLFDWISRKKKESSCAFASVLVSGGMGWWSSPALHYNTTLRRQARHGLEGRRYHPPEQRARPLVIVHDTTHYCVPEEMMSRARTIIPTPRLGRRSCTHTS